MHLQEDVPSNEGFSDAVANMAAAGITIDRLAARDEMAVVGLIRKILADFPEAGTVLAATFRRLERMTSTYTAEGACYFVVRDQEDGRIIGGAGLGPMAGLPFAEGVGEVRDMVLDQPYRGKGLARRLLQRCMIEAKSLHYKRVYLETTPQMEKARRLFTSFGFKPVEQKTSSREPSVDAQFPCYFVLDLTPVPPESIDD